MPDKQTRKTEVRIASLSKQDAHIVLGVILKSMNARNLLHKRLDIHDLFDMFLLILGFAESEGHAEIETADVMAVFYAKTIEKELEDKAEAFVAETVAFIEHEKITNDVMYQFALIGDTEEMAIHCEISGRTAQHVPKQPVPKRNDKIVGPGAAQGPHFVIDTYIAQIKEARHATPEVFECLDLRMAGIDPTEEQMVRDALYGSAELLMGTGHNAEPTMDDIANFLLDTDNVTLKLAANYVARSSMMYLQGHDDALDFMPAILLLQQHCVNLAGAMRVSKPVPLNRFSNLLLTVADYFFFSDAINEEEGWE